MARPIIANTASKGRKVEATPVDAAILEAANWWFDTSWYGLLIAGALTAIAALATVGFLFVQFWSSGIKERHTEWRTTALESETAKANAARSKSDERIAELNKDTARLSSEAESARAAIAGANERAAKAEEKAAEANLALMKYKAPRNLSAEQSEKLIGDLREFGPITYDLAYPKMMEPGSFLVSQLIKVFTELNWNFVPYEGPLPKQEMSLIDVKSLPAEMFAEWPFKKFLSGETSQLIGIRIGRQFRASNIKAADKLAADLLEFGLYTEPVVTPPPGAGESRSNVLRIVIGSKQ